MEEKKDTDTPIAESREETEIPPVASDNDKPSVKDSTVADGKSSEEIDPFFYLKTDEFTSEKFKIEIFNLPRKFGFTQLKKRLNVTLGLKSHKIKAPNTNYAFVTFKCEEDREEAIQKINGHIWKGNKLSAKIAKPAADPLLKKRKKEEEADAKGPSEKKSKVDSVIDDTPPHIRIKKSVTPFWDVPYEEQLKRKTDSITDVLLAVAMRRDVRDIFTEARKKYDGKCCELLPIIQSPALEGYRNKNEFSIGKNIDGKDNCVGFRYGLYKDGFSTVGSASHVSILPESVKTVVQLFEEFLSTSVYRSYNQGTHEGHWRQLTVRTTRTGEMMIIAEFQRRDIIQEDIDAEKSRLTEFFTNGPGKSFDQLTSMYFVVFDSGQGQSDKNYEHLFGEKIIKERMLDMTFQISPDAFFQVNTSAAELLYNQIGDWCNIQSGEQTTVLDICCGTGTIGLALAKKVTKVIGIEMCQQAIDDAKENAKINGITNVTYYCSKAEDAIVNVMRSLWTSNVVAVVDPPRAGLHKTVLKSLRNCRRLKRLIYVACNPNAAKDNFIDLVRSASKKLKGLPYRPIKAVPVDLFPMTPHCELVVLFEREAEEHKDSDSDIEMISTATKNSSTLGSSNATAPSNTSDISGSTGKVKIVQSNDDKQSDGETNSTNKSDQQTS
ncbi:tRNA (uracil-5-)-methyltransferase homolog A [Patella vulgata]|uniref:tRNA (uracil-5-)-methyltransferase homolog A n=1 Tax=Patella vulgata TaxID=6465 RepID=UPI00217FC67C|nr:tRNA (uracil-5-)-methyltransferase homolog A [Patella vulgata]XP_050410107.1 tRNA (uracil-5-)-methyltransferase homolog A [Patella vulgata]XP_050410108.1 tRNA (uracil-5-)-methyltransferase homolog A [Patella vulgata]